jgi:hypothetical protein
VTTTVPSNLLADAVLLLHFGIVVFVVGGLVVIVAGNLRGWRWVNRWWWRLVHLAAILVVVAESWFGVMCPLTTLEPWLRARSGSTAYRQGFVETWVQALLFYDAPGWVFTFAYTVFGLAVVGVWLRYPPRRGQAASA